MFSYAFAQQETLKLFHKIIVDRCEVDLFPDGAWLQIVNFLEFLEVFKIATTILSRVYYPTSCWVIEELYNISLNFKESESKNDLFNGMVVPMKEIFRKYFEDIPPMFTCAAALNHYLNVAGVEAVIEEIYDNLDTHEIDSTLSTKAKENYNQSLQEIYDHYFKIYGPSSKFKIVRQATTSMSAKDKLITMMNVVFYSTAKRQRGNTLSSELGRYSGANYVEGVSVKHIHNHDILTWWKGKQNTFPILSAIARDLLSIQASTVASKSVVSLSGRVLSMRRTKLTPESLEICVFIKDNLDAVDRIQDKTNLKDEIPLERPIQNHDMEEGLSSEENEDKYN